MGANKTLNVIYSCKTYRQLLVAERYMRLYFRRYQPPIEAVRYFEQLLDTRLQLLKGQ